MNSIGNTTILEILNTSHDVDEVLDDYKSFQFPIFARLEFDSDSVFSTNQGEILSTKDSVQSRFSDKILNLSPKEDHEDSNLFDRKSSRTFEFSRKYFYKPK
jgi:hypothetical protein